MKQRRKALKITFAAIAVIAWIGFIFGNSFQTGSESGALSGEIVALIERALPVLKTWLTSEQLHVIIRKGAHFSEYAILSFLLWLFWHQVVKAQVQHLIQRKFQAKKIDRLARFEYSTIMWQTLKICLLTGLLVALTDETIQTFVPARAGMVTDVWIDFAGVLTMQIGLAFIWYQVQKRK